MLNESLLLSSFSEIKDLLFNELTILHVATVYVLMYVVYKALGRYIYFKPEEHASKVNRTFLTLSLLIVILHGLHRLITYLPFIDEYRWLYALCSLVVLIAPLSIIVYRIIWKYQHGRGNARTWHYYFLPIPKDYYKTNISKSKQNGNSSYSWEEEGVESTSRNIHSDALLNILALMVFVTISGRWAHVSAVNYDYFSYVFFGIVCLTIIGIFIDSAVFSWIDYLENKLRKKR